MSLRRAPQRHQRIEIRAWAGTPAALVDLAETIRSLLPEGSLQATVSSEGLADRETDNPAGLGEVRESDHVTGFSIKAEFSEQPDGGSYEYSIIELRMFRHGGYLWISSPTELQTRTIVGVVEGALNQHRPAWTWMKSKMLLTAVTVLLLSLTFLSGVALLAIAMGLKPEYAWSGAAILWMPATLVGFSVFEFLFPALLVYENQSRARRFAGWLLSIVIIPFILALIFAVVTNRN
jgi:hypothetical protein